MGQAHFSRSRVGPAADQASIADGVMWRAERARRAERYARRQEARHAVDLGRLQRLVQPHAREGSWAGGEPASSSLTGWTDQQDVVRPRRRDLERPLRGRLPSHIREIHQVVIPSAHKLGHVTLGRLDRSVSREVAANIEQRPRTVHRYPLHHRRLVHILGGQHDTVESRGACGERHGKRPANRTQISFETQLTQQQQMRQPLRADLTARDQECRSRSADRRRSRPFGRPPEPD